jgi:hypothetical protein
MQLTERRATIVAMTIAVVVAVATACSKHEAPRPGDVDVPPPTPACPAIASRFRDTLAHAPGTCHVDADCGCYDPVVEEVGCGGVTDRATATRLQAIEAEFLGVGCPWPHLCAAIACTPVCHEGRCMDRLAVAP